MLSQFASRTCWRSHKSAKPRIRGNTARHRRFWTVVKPPPFISPLHHIDSSPARPAYAEAVYTYLDEEWKASRARQPDIPDVLKGIEDLLPMASDHLAIESVKNIREKLSGLIRNRKWRADKLKSTHPDEADEILLGNTRLEAVRRELKLFYVNKYFPENSVNGGYDVLIGDITEKTLFTSLSDLLGVRYLSHVDPKVPPEWPVKGIVFGPNKRVFVNLILSNNKHSLNVFFLVNTTSYYNYVSPTVLAALEEEDDYGRYHLHGDVIDLFPSPQRSHFADLNVLGRDYFSFYAYRRHKLLVDYPSQTCTIFKDGCF